MMHVNWENGFGVLITYCILRRLFIHRLLLNKTEYDLSYYFLIVCKCFEQINFIKSSYHHACHVLFVASFDNLNIFRGNLPFTYNGIISYLTRTNKNIFTPCVNVMNFILISI